MIRAGGETSRATLGWSLATIAGLLALLGMSRMSSLRSVWEVLGGAVEGRAAQDARNDGYYEELLDATVARGAGGWRRGPSEIAPRGWVRLHETDGVRWDDPFHRFRLNPGADFDYKGAPLAVNELGLRDRPTTRVKPKGVRRVAMVGASVLMGSGVPVEATFENLIEDAIGDGVLGDRGEVELLNFAVAGYRLDQLADVVVTRLDSFDPDAVVLVLNDLAVNPNWSRHVVRLVAEERDLRHDFLRRVVDASGIRAGDDPRRMTAQLAVHRDVVIEGALRVARDWCRARGIPLVLLAVQQPARTSTFRERLDGIRDVPRALGIPVVDIADAFDDVAEPERLWLRAWDRHPTAEGHALMAARFLTRLQSDEDLADLIVGAARSRGDGAPHE